jgi:hypothetical protein
MASSSSSSSSSPWRTATKRRAFIRVLLAMNKCASQARVYRQPHPPEMPRSHIAHQNTNSKKTACTNGIIPDCSISSSAVPSPSVSLTSRHMVGVDLASWIMRSRNHNNNNNNNRSSSRCCRCCRCCCWAVPRMSHQCRLYRIIRPKQA